MKRRLSILALTALAVVALTGLVLTVPTPVHAGGATQISGLGEFDDGSCGEITHDGQTSDFANKLSGDLTGCLYGFVETFDCRPSGTYIETGTETFVGTYNGKAGTFRTTYRFTAKFADCNNLTGQVFGRCQHPITAGNGTDDFTGVSGRLDFKDDIDAGNFPYTGHLRW